ncbi:hypothetical protein AMTR_s00096p00032360 [Amborella trichopoda]|uniref:Uncharacterized protein n=1 Tax=Amborella trichopoda TaxID=13333 RepID=W1NXK6_AMBTC|nr:hypothetical protein AMTR_s00096p00032360 [Amborella trichopoda]
MLMPPVLIEIPFVFCRHHLSSWKSFLSPADATCPPGDPFCLPPRPPIPSAIPSASCFSSKNATWKPLEDERSDYSKRIKLKWRSGTDKYEGELPAQGKRKRAENRGRIKK